MARVNFVKSFRGTSKTEDGNRRCGRSGCGTTIAKGDSYYWWANKLPGSRSGHKQFRCINHRPTLAETTPGRRGQLYQLQDDIGTQLEEAQSQDDLQAAASFAADQVREWASEMTESAENIESGFEHPTQQSEALQDKAQELESVADEIESVDIEDEPEDITTCEDCDTELQDGLVCQECNHEHEDPTDAWLEEQRQKIQDAVDEIDIDVGM